MSDMQAKDLKRGQFMYICEAALEYLISILVGGSFLATLTGELGFSDSLTGILSSVISLGCIFQMLSIFLRRKKVKWFVIGMSVTNQLLFMLLYVIPVFEISGTVKTILFVVFIFTAYFIYNIAHPKKINWLMSLVEDGFRGVFTANKEIVSLICGMAFTYGMGAWIDHFSAKNEMRTSLILSATVIFVLMILHTLTLMLTPEPELPKAPTKNIFLCVKDVFQNKEVMKVTLVFVLYNIAAYSAGPFYGTYLIGELALSLKIISVLSIVSSIVRIFVSRFWGKYADKTSFSNMIQKCFLVLAAGYGCVVLAVPENGMLMFTLYYLCSGIAMGGINSALINMIYDYVSIEKRADSLAVCQASSGLVGFLSTLIFSVFVAFVQENGNKIFGIHMYAQQAVSIVACMMILVAYFYVRKVITKHN